MKIFKKLNDNDLKPGAIIYMVSTKGKNYKKRNLPSTIHRYKIVDISCKMSMNHKIQHIVTILHSSNEMQDSVNIKTPRKMPATLILATFCKL
jgi:hypothetical protein